MSIDVLQKKIRKLKNPTMLGLDPTPELIPPHILDEKMKAHGQTPKAMAAAYEDFCVQLLDALAGKVPAVKLQAVCFEALGAEGVAAMQRVNAHAKQLDYYVLLDWARSDVPHTAEVAAKSIFEGVAIGDALYQPYDVDGITLNAYTGSDGVKPFLQYCKSAQKNVFLTVKSSNASTHEVQDLLSGDRIVHTVMADLAERWGTGMIGKYGYSEVGMIVGAVHSRNIKQLRKTYDRLFMMIPGYGAQGGEGVSVQDAFDQFGYGAIVVASRSIIGAWKTAKSDGTDFVEQAVAAAKKMKEDILEYVVIL